MIAAKRRGWPGRNLGSRAEDKYPWAVWWASKRPIVLIQGQDYTCRSESLRQRIWARARDDRVTVSVRTERRPDGLDVLTLTVIRKG